MDQKKGMVNYEIFLSKALCLPADFDHVAYLYKRLGGSKNMAINRG
jgi:hypothetical protein